MYQRHFLITALTIAGCISPALTQQAADTVLYNGKVLTVDSSFSVAQAVAVRGSQIAAVGTNDEVLRLAGPNTRKIDLKGKTVVPGLIDTHVHLESVGPYAADVPSAKRKEYPLNLRTVQTKDDVLKQIRDIIAAFQFPEGQWLFFPTNPRGKDQARILFDELNATELDKAAPNNPIVLSVGVPKHNVALLNRVALDALWRKYGDAVETYGRYRIDAFGRPSGQIEAPASRIIWEDEEFALGPEPEDVAPAYRKLLEERSALGVTTLSGALATSSVRAYKWLEAQGRLPMRYGYGNMRAFIPGADLKQYTMGAGTDEIWVTSVSSRAVDGAGSRMCISLERNSDSARAYEEAGGSGEGVFMGLSTVSEWWPRGQCSLDIEYGGAGGNGARIKANHFMEFYNRVAAEGLRSANVHISGNDSYARIISELERIDRANPGSVKGWAMDHCTLVNPADVLRAAKLGLMWSCSALGEGNRPALMASAFGEQTIHEYVAPIKSMIDNGINVSLEGDWEDIETLITRKDATGKVWGPDQGLDRVTALKVATQNGANYVLKGDKLGSIEPGKLADLVVIDRDYLTISEEDISEIRSLLTMMGGKFIFLRTDFADEHDLKPAGAVISTFEELRARRPRFGSDD